MVKEMSADDIVVDLIQADEGYSEIIYEDTLGNLTVGYGTLLREGVKIPGAALEIMFGYKLAESVAYYNSLGLNLSGPRRAVIISMLYQLGYSGVKGFKNMLYALYAGDYENAAKHMLDSKWAVQTPARAQRSAEIMRTGKI